MYSSTPSPTVAGSLEANERAALCALVALLRDVHPLLGASKCWKFLGWRGERNTLTGLYSSRAAFFSFPQGDGEESPECFFRARRQLCALASLFKMSLVFIWHVGVTAGKRKTTRCWCLNRRWQAGMLEQLFLSGLLWCPLQWQMTVLMLPIVWAALGNFSLCPSNSVGASHGFQLGMETSCLLLSSQ